MKLPSLAAAAAATLRVASAQQPPEIRSVDGLLEATLTVSIIETPGLDNRTAPGYNGLPVGPTLRARPGDTVRITLKNELEPSSEEDVEKWSFAMTPQEDEGKELNQTLLVNRLHNPSGNIWALPREEYWGKQFQNLHFHGLMVDPSIDDSRVWIDGGDEKVYEFTIPEDSPPLFGWYHNHVHGTATYSMLSGLYGAFVIEEPVDDSTPTETNEQFLLLSEMKNYEDGTPADFLSVVMDFSWEHVTNGHLSPTMTFKKGETVNFRAVNAGIEPAYTLSIEEHMLTPHAMDGYPVPQIESETVTLDAGSRAEFMVTFDTPGEFVFKRAGWNGGVAGELCMILLNIPATTCISYDKETQVGTIVVLDEETADDGTEEGAIVDEDTGEVVELEPFDRRKLQSGQMQIDEALDAATGEDSEDAIDAESSDSAMHPFLQDLLSLPKAGSRMLFFDQAEGHPIFQVPYNGTPPELGEVGFPGGMGVNGLLFNPHYFHGDIKGGTCEDWTVISRGPPIHSFHAHSIPFFVTMMNGVELAEGDRFWRDTMVTGFNFTATFCFPSRATETYVNVHCHMPTHQDIGMAAFYKLLPGDEPSDVSPSSPTTKPASDPGSMPPTSDSASEPTTEPTSGANLIKAGTLGAIAFGVLFIL